MTMKKTELDKRAGLKVAHQMKHATAQAQRPGAVPAAEVDRRTRREAQRAAGLVPFAVKLPQTLVSQVQALAAQRAVALDAITAQLLEQALSHGGPCTD